MDVRRAASRALFALGALALAGAVGLLLASYARPSTGFEDLGRFVGALLLAGLAAVPFSLSLLVWRPPRWHVALAGAGCAIALLPAAAMLVVGVKGSTIFGLLFLVSALVGLWRAWSLRG